ncbi:MAG: hypothetical protein J6K58_06165 [Lachnospiraceae bacterium]|nr:hypothetical protein [Lachnospiraceae bacterium]
MIKNFFTCGLVGWCLEILFTACNGLKNRDFKLKGNTSLWMFPIYGLAAFFKPAYRFIRNWPLIFRGLFYTICIFTTEFLTGSALKKRRLCPWNYESSPYNVDGVIRFDYAPYWFGTGLLYEYILTRRHREKNNLSTQ